MSKSVTYIVSDIDKALAFEWIAEQIDRSKVELSFILLLRQPAYLSGFLQQRGIPCHCVYYRSNKDLPRLIIHVWRLLRKIRPAAVHCHLFTGALVGLSAGKLAGVRERIYTRHHADYHHRYFPQGIKWDKWCNRLATKIVAPSKAVWQVLVEMEGVSPARIATVHHGFDLEYFRSADPDVVKGLGEKYGSTGRYPVVGVISRFTELKGIQYIIPAFRRLLGQFPEAKVLFFNACGDYEPTLRQMLADLPADSYTLIPFERDLASAYQLMDVFVQVSTDYTIEAFGQTYVEALAAGVPSVFTLSGIARDFIEDGRNALVVPFKDSDAIYEAMQRLLSDEGLRQRLRLNGRKSVEERFALSEMISRLEALYTAAPAGIPA